MQNVIDVSVNVGAHADDIARNGVQTVIRYYNHRNSQRMPGKRLESTEAQALTQAGLSLMTVFQQGGGHNAAIEQLSEENGKSDAERALDLASNLGQPEGSAIYFAVDWDYFRVSEIDRIIPYFAAIRDKLANHYRVGVYGSGTICDTMQALGLADLIWLSGSTGWSGTQSLLQTDRWALFQKYLERLWPDGSFRYDGNIINPAFADFGQFSLSGNPVPPSSTPLHLMEVIARSGLKLRKGPGLEFSTIQILPAGSVVTAVGKTNDWIQVDLEGDGLVDGFMHSSYLRTIAGGFPLEGSIDSPYAIARAELALGVREIPGDSHNPRIVMYHTTTRGGASPDETAWCSSFVNYCVIQAGLQGTDSKWAMSWHDSQWGADVTAAPAEGDLVVFKRRADSASGTVLGGHVGFLVSQSDDHIQVLGGNQSNAVNIRSYPKNGMLGQNHYQLLSIRRP